MNIKTILQHCRDTLKNVEFLEKNKLHIVNFNSRKSYGCSFMYDTLVEIDTNGLRIREIYSGEDIFIKKFQKKYYLSKLGSLL